MDCPSSRQQRLVARSLCRACCLQCRDRRTGTHRSLRPRSAYYIWAIDNGRVLWSRQTEACELDLYLYDLNTRQDIRLTDDCEAQIEVSADIGGEWVVWKGYLTEDIHALNLATNERQRITNTLYTESFPIPMDNVLSGNKTIAIPIIGMFTDTIWKRVRRFL